MDTMLRSVSIAIGNVWIDMSEYVYATSNNVLLALYSWGKSMCELRTMLVAARGWRLDALLLGFDREWVFLYSRECAY